MEGSLRLVTLTNLRVEPRALLSGNAAEGDSVPGCTPRTVYRRGVPREVYPGIYTGRYTHHGTRATYTTLVYPPWYPGYIYHRVTPLIPGYTPQDTPLIPGLIHLRYTLDYTRVNTPEVHPSLLVRYPAQGPGRGTFPVSEVRKVCQPSVNPLGNAHLGEKHAERATFSPRDKNIPECQELLVTPAIAPGRYEELIRCSPSEVRTREEYP